MANTNTFRRDDVDRQVAAVMQSVATEFRKQVQTWARPLGVDAVARTEVHRDPVTAGYLLQLAVERSVYTKNENSDGQQLVRESVMTDSVTMGSLEEMVLPNRHRLLLQDVNVRTAVLLDRFARLKGLSQTPQASQAQKPKGEPAVASAPSFMIAGITIAGFRFEHSGKPNHVWMHRADGPHAGEGAEVHTDMLRKALADFFTKEF